MTDTDSGEHPTDGSPAQLGRHRAEDVVRGASGTGRRRAAVHRELAAGDVASMRDLASRLQGEGIDVTPESLRSDVRALGAVRVQHGDGTVLALPVDDGQARPVGASDRLAAEVSTDPDWRIQVGVVAVVALFLVVGFLGWLLSL